ncbi:TPA: metal-dependent transcriptional regulator [Streptococcus agalactiae]
MHKIYWEENYLENIYMLYLNHDEVRHKDLKNKMGRAKSVVTKAISTLVERGYVTYGEDKIIRFTDAGLHIAEKVHRKHLYLIEFLLKTGIDRERADIEACHIEHVLSDDSFEKIKKFIGGKL